MLPREQNQLICEIEPGAPMHEVFKRYWLPCGMSSDVAEPDSDPVRVTLLGEDFVMFRDTAGQVAVMNERCCHRGASLCLGRVEDGGIRCIYHGWKFAADGAIMDMPNCDEEQYKTRYRQPAYPVREAGGFVWAYLGPEEHQPPFPHYPFFDVPLDHVWCQPAVVGANYLQTVEGLLDSSHLGVLHSDALMARSSGGGGTEVFKMLKEQKSPKFEVQDEEFGFRYAAVREVPDENGVTNIARVTAFQFPSTVYIAPDNVVIFLIPEKNGKTSFYNVFWKWDAPYTEEEIALNHSSGGVDEKGLKWGLGREYFGKPGTANRENNFLQDRAAMRAGKTFSGLINFLPEDAAVVTSAGELYDRSRENLVPADLAVARARRVLLNNLRQVQGGGQAMGLAPNPPARPAMGPITSTCTWQEIPYAGDRNREMVNP